MSMIGKTPGNFAIEAQIGKGGMGEVYRAKDQKLGRDVAIKALPEEFAKDADRVARFAQRTMDAHQAQQYIARINVAGHWLRGWKKVRLFHLSGLKTFARRISKAGSSI